MHGCVGAWLCGCVGAGCVCVSASLSLSVHVCVAPEDERSDAEKILKEAFVKIDEDYRRSDL